MLNYENKWRAVRYELDGKMIDFGKGKEVQIRALIRELMEFVDDVIDDLGSRKEIEHINTILDRGTSADHQLRVWRDTGDIKAVVDRAHVCGLRFLHKPLTPAAGILPPRSAGGSWKKWMDKRLGFAITTSVDGCALNASRCLLASYPTQVQAAVFARVNSGSATSSSKSVR
jgi:hypothetical protein